MICFYPKEEASVWCGLGTSVSVGASLSVQGRFLNGDAGTPHSTLGRVRERLISLFWPLSFYLSKTFFTIKTKLPKER